MKRSEAETEPVKPVRFPSGPGVILWSRVCRDCGAYAGGCFSGPDLPAPEVGEYAVCPACGGKRLYLEQELGQHREDVEQSMVDALKLVRAGIGEKG